ncbi:hypothetical protein A3K93_06965 [Acinetobacter sp. NCu2D-2]|uniref:hypothetical protein n=1 Tax=Acinetobacter sp. NCu2D-2 TaxID=1608473 RepID=UPI0007CE0AA6|nr:hypothetical protein [Acinetobacter sp. NCu2D-2]ANF81958.1 hypothetical protein A3K93_06965 [Acinetobacter sp. NCu2D-2]
MKITETIVDFAKLSTQKKHNFFQEILSFDRQIFPHSSVEELYDYMYDINAVSVPVVQYHHNGRLIGQNVIPILQLQLEGKPIYVVTSRAGVLAEYRHKNLTLGSAIRVAIRHRLRYPKAPLWFVSTLMQPKVYTLFASRSQYFFPRHNVVMPDVHRKIIELMLSRNQQAEERSDGIYVCRAVMPKVTPDQLIRLRNRSDDHIRFFMQHVPDYFEGKGLMCVCLLDFKTIIETTWNLTMGRYVH